MNAKQRIYCYFYKKRIKETFLSRRIYEFLLRQDDPLISYKINGRECTLPFSYQGAIFMEKFPLYDRQLAQINRFVKRSLERNLCIIDVGANIGDTVINIGDTENKYLCIEGVEEWVRLIYKNLKNEFDYKVVSSFCSDMDEKNKKQVKLSGGGDCNINRLR